MIPHDTLALTQYTFSVIKIVPDPVKDEAVNVGIIVLDPSGDGQLHWNPRVKTRVRAIHPTFSLEAVEAAIEGLQSALEPETNLLQPWRAGAISAPPALLASLSQQLNNQLQLTPPRAYRAASLSDAVERLYRRYVASRPLDEEGRNPKKRLTHAQLKERIWKIVKAWDDQSHVHVDQEALLDGATARHAADIVIRNGSPRAALFALPTDSADRTLAYLYRDSLPTIARDMERPGESFRVYAVLPNADDAASDDDRAFARETEALLKQQQVRALQLDELPTIRQEVLSHLF